MKKVSLTLAVKLIISIIVAEFFIMAIIVKLPILEKVSPVIIAFIDTFILGIVAIVVVKFTFRPLRDMAVKMEEIRKGKLNVRLDIGSSDEIGGIAKQINYMVEGMEAYYRKIEESEKLLSTITNGIDEEIMLIDDKFKVLWVNKKTRELSHLEEKEVIGSYCYKLTHHLDEPCKEPLDICPILDISKRKQKIGVLHTHFDKEGRPFYVEVIAHPLPDEKGQITRFIHISRDVTERMKMIKEIEEAKNKLEEYNRKLENMVEERTNKLTKNLIELANTNDELRRTHSQLVQAGKMAAIGQLAVGVAHEINNPLTVILNNAQLIKIWIEQKKEFSPEELKRLVNVIEDSIIRCNKITQDLLGFSHVSIGKFEKFSIAESIIKVIDLIGYEMSLENIRIKREIDPDMPFFKGDSLAIQQVFLNIIINAHWAIQKKSGRKGGDILIKSQYNKDNNYIYVNISDTGIGIPEKNISRIFEAFYTTKDIGKGTGLGLSLVYNIIKQHKGEIEVESKEDEGTTFKIKLPLAR
ncbi:MAG: ATP-binding protein [Candidatus Omnitrophota bacterium]